MAQEAIATVTSISGRAQARNAEGELRELKVGDKLLAGETVVTPDGGTVELALSDGSPLTVSGVPEMAITRDLMAETAAGADESAVEDETVQQVLAALESGEDLGEVLPETAAGVESISGAQGEGHSWIRLGRIDETTSEFSGMVGSIAGESEAIEDENPPPVDAIDDFATTEQGVPVVINVLPNDDFQLGANVISVTNGEHGTVVINSDNTVTYSPDPDFSGEDVFTYTAVSADGTGQDTANVTVVIPEVPVIPPPPIPEPLPTISIDDMEVKEGETATLTISLSKAWDETITVQYRTADDTAQSLNPTFDYDPVTQLITVTFLPGETSKEVTFSTNVDNIEEATEQFLVNLSNPTNATIADPTGIVEIIDDFTPPPPPPIIPPPPPPPPGALDVEGGDTTRNEIYLPQGRTPTPGELSVTKTFEVTAEDGLTSLTVTPGGGGAAANVVVGSAFQAGQSVVEGPILIEFDSLSGPVGGVYTVTYTATLQGEFVHDQQGEDLSDTLKVTIEISDPQGDTASADATLTVIDDIPNLNPDTDITESGTAVGDVVTGVGTISDGPDIPGADGWVAPAAMVVGVSNAGQVTGGTGVGVAVDGSQGNGKLTLLADGSYTYEANGTPANPGEPDVFYYTVEDGDGDFVTTTLTISLDGEPIISNLTPRAEGGDVQVDEDDLVPDGSDTSKESTTQPGTFTITSPDGVDSLTIGGNAFITGGVFTAGSFVTPLGNTLEVTGYNAGSGVVSYTYTLEDNEAHANADGENVLFEDLAVVLTDTDTGVANGTLTAGIIDDVPEAKADADTTTVSGDAAGNVIAGTGMVVGMADIAGADGLDDPAVVGVTLAAGDTTDGTGVGVAVSSAKGDLTLNANGSFTYDRTDDTATGTDVFYYTIIDNDGDPSTTTLTITLDSDPTITNLTPKGEDGDVVVDEDDLVPDGSDTSKESTTQPGTFTITSPDGVDSLTIGGNAFITGGVFTAGSFVTPLGNTLEVTGYNAGSGVVSYTYTLEDNEAHANADGENVLFEDFAVVLTDPDTGVANGTLTAGIIDDVPEAKADADTTTVSGDAAGNVIAGTGMVVGMADIAGADGLDDPAVVGVTLAAGDTTDGTGVGVAVSSAKGDLTLNANGSFTYDRTDDTATGTDVFYYTIIDNDGDPSTTTLTITLDSDPTITNLTPKGEDGDVVVDEDDLVPDGSDTSKESTTQPGTFTITSPDGVDSLTIGGNAFITGGVFTAGSFVTPLGNTLEVTGYNAGSGVVSYTYTLEDNEAHANADGENVLFEDFAVVLTDPDTGVANGTLTAGIIDDVPEAKADADMTASGSAAGNVIDGTGMVSGMADIAGADGLDDPAVVGVTLAAGDTIDGSGVGVVVSSIKGDLTLNANGSFTYTQTDANATGTDVFYYTIIDNDGDPSTTTLTITLDGEPIITNLTPKASGGDVQVDEDDLVPDGSDTSKESTTQPGTFTITSPDGVDSLTIGGNAFITGGVFTAGSFVTPLGNTLEVTGYNAGSGVVSYTYTLDDNEAHANADGENVLFEDLAVVLTDTDTGVANGTLTAGIIDDVPEAKADADTTTVSGDAAGNVIAGTGMVVGMADIAGADGLDDPAVVGVTLAAGDTTDGTGVGVAVSSAKGDLTLNANGSFTYDRTDDTATGTDVFYYTIIDNDGDPSTTTLTITLDSDPTITNLTPKGEDGDVVVDEDDLVPDGSDTSKESTTQPGTFTITSPDGVDSLTIGGNAFITGGVFTAGSFVTPLGNTLEVTGYNAGSGVVSYTYTLDDNEAHANADGENVLFEDFAVVLTDPDTGVANGTLTAGIIDDVPEAKADADTTTVSGDAAGNVIAGTGMVVGMADIAGADGLDDPAVVGVTLAAGDTTDGTGVGVAVSSAKGDLTLNANGSFTYDRTDDTATGTDVFYYTIIDNDGDPSTTTLTITLDSDPTITNLTPKGEDGDVVVDEDDLVPDGSDTSKESTTQPGTFTITSPDGVDSLTIGGNAFITGGVFTAGSFVTPLGNTLEVTGYNAGSGVVSYTYTLDDNEAHANADGENVLFEDFAVVLTDPDTGVANGTLSAGIVDDVPEARADEDKTSSGSADGNVLLGTGMVSGAADVPGADGLDNPAVVGVTLAAGDTIDGSGVGVVVSSIKGDLTLNADGSFTYTVTDDGATGSDVFHYTIIDNDGDPSTTTLTINLDSDPIITNLTPKAEGGDVQVDEDDLLAARGADEADGTDQAKESTTQPGTLTIAAGDGIDGLTIGGNAFITGGVFTAGSFVTPLGNTLEVTGYNAGSGVVSYTYTLDDNEAHANADGENVLFEDLAVVLTDTDTGVANGTLSAGIIDDVPEVGDFLDFSVPNAIGVTAGTTNTGFLSGADNWADITVTGSAVAGLTYLAPVVNTDASGNVTSVVLTAEETGSGDDVLSYTVFADGQHSFDLIKPEAASETTVSLLNLSPGGPTPFLELPDYTIEFTGTGNGVNSSTQGMGISNQFIGDTEMLTMEFYDPGRAGDDTPDNTSEPASATENLISKLAFSETGGGGELDWTVYNDVDSTQTSGTVVDSSGGFVIDPGMDFNRIEITGGGDAKARLTQVIITKPLLPDGEVITFDVTGTDNDGDPTSTDQVTVTIEPGVAPDAFAAPASFAQSAPVEDSGPETVIQTATAEADTLLATDDADVFAWSLADNTVAGDLIVGFDEGSDAISIADILEDTTDTADFSSYLDVSLGDDGVSTVIKVSNSGDFENAQQTITVEGVNLVDGVDLDDSAALATALQNLVDAGKLVTE